MHGAEVDVMAVNALLTKFSQSQIFHDEVPENGTYPMVCYTDITQSAVMHTDNALYGYEHIIRVTIVTFANADINSLVVDVYDCMTEAGFMWVSTNKTREGKEYYTAMDFSMAVLS